MTRTRILLTLGGAVACVFAGFGQGSENARSLAPVAYFSDLQQARELYASRQYAKALPILERLVESYPESGETLLLLGRSHYRAGKPQLAIVPMERAFAVGGDNKLFGSIDTVAYDLACMHALSGNNDKAFKWLDTALALRFENRAIVSTDKDLENLRSDPRFAKYAGSATDVPPRTEAWSKDLDFLLSEMRRLHVSHAAGLPKQLIQDAEKLRARISSLSDTEVVVEIQHLLTMLGDGHSWVRMAGMPHGSEKLPLQMYSFDDGLHIVRTRPEDARYVGARVLQIGSKTPEQLLESSRAYVSRDNDKGIPWLAPIYILPSPAYLKALGATDGSLDVALRLRLPNGSEETKVFRAVELKAGEHVMEAVPFIPEVSGKERPLSARGPHAFFWMARDEEHDACYVQFNGIADMPNETLESFALKLRNDLKSNPATSLIIDLRRNSGGNEGKSIELFRTVVWFSAQDPKNRVFVITSRNTFSAAQIFLNQLERFIDPIIVGEPSSSRPMFVGESTRVTLPHSKVVMTISSRLHTVQPRDQRAWIPPDVPVTPRARDYFTGRDAELEAVYGVIGRK